MTGVLVREPSVDERPDRAQRRASVVLHPAFVATVLVLVLGGAFLGSRSIELDESISAGLGRGSWDALWRGVAEDGGSQSLYFLAVRLFAFLGDDPWVIRLPALLSAAAVPYPLYRLVEPRFGRGVATRAVLLLAVSYSFVTNAQEARAYTMLAAVLTWTWFVVDRALETGRFRLWLAAGLLAALSLYAQPLGVPVLMAQAIWVLADRRRVPPVPVLAAAVVAGAAAAPFAYLTLFEAVDHTEWLGGFTVARFVELVSAALGAQRVSESVALSIAGVVAVGLLAGLGALPIRNRVPFRDGGLLFALWATVPIVVLLAGSVSRAYFSARYAVPLVPATATLAAIGTERLRALDRRLAVAAFLGVIGVLGARTVTGYRTEPVPWVDLEAYVAEQATPDDMIAFEPAYAQAPFEYYTWLQGHADTMARPMPPSIGWTAPRHPNTEEYPDTEIAPPEGDLWVVVRAEIGVSEVPDIVARLGIDMVEVDRRSFGDAVVLRFAAVGS